MKKLITLFVLFLSIGIANAQTKEETIKWLKEKLGLYMKGENEQCKNIVLERINECEIVLSYQYRSPVANVYMQYTQILPTAIASISGEGKFTYSANVASDQEQGKEAQFSTSSYLRLGNREENIRERVEKALKHLATFCPKKQETF